MDRRPLRRDGGGPPGRGPRDLRRGAFLRVLRRAYALQKLTRRKPSLVVDEEGVFDNASALGAGAIRWEEVEEVFAFVFRGQPMIGMTLKDEDAVLVRQDPLKRALMLVEGASWGPVANIPQNVLPMPVEDLLREIERRRGDSIRG